MSSATRSEPSPCPTLQWFSWGGLEPTPEVIEQINAELAPYKIRIVVERQYCTHHTEPSRWHVYGAGGFSLVGCCSPQELTLWLHGHIGGGPEHWHQLLLDLHQQWRRR